MSYHGRDPQSGRDAVSLLATVVVFVMGFIACGGVIMVSMDKPGAPLGGLAAFMLIVFWLLMRLRAGAAEAGVGFSDVILWMQSRDRTDPTQLYKPRRKRTADSIPLGENRPPTVEDIRALQDYNVRWVPKGSSEPPAASQQQA
jgi:hypothetical protein